MFGPENSGFEFGFCSPGCGSVGWVWQLASCCGSLQAPTQLRRMREVDLIKADKWYGVSKVK